MREEKMGFVRENEDSDLMVYGGEAAFVVGPKGGRGFVERVSRGRESCRG